MTNIFGSKKDKSVKAIANKKIKKDDVFHPEYREFADVRSREIVSRRNWQVFAFLCLALAGYSEFSNSKASHEPKLVPYVVVVDKLGQQQSLGVPARVDPNAAATVAVIQYQLQQFIQSTRQVISDTNFQQKILAEIVKPYLEPGTAGTRTVYNFLDLNDPIKYYLTNRRTIDVKVDLPIMQTSNTFELHWIETTKDAAGGILSKSEWRGFATVTLHEVSQAQLQLNPLGIYIQDLRWQSVSGDNSTNGVRQ